MTAREDRRLARLSKICLALPEATRQMHGDHASFRVRKKVFAYFLDNHHGDGIVALSCKMSLGENHELVAMDPKRFYIPAYIGPRGWIGVRLDVKSVDWNDVRDFVIESYKLVAPKRLAALAATP
jgi:predicted DNA-binding protein (MmcQ/YjbR family)